VTTKTVDLTLYAVSIFYSHLFLLLMTGHRKSRMRGMVRRAKEREGREEEERSWE
jgi:uncharacterized membrane protein